MSLAFSEYLSNLGVDDSYVSPSASDLAEEGRTAINAEKRKIENLKKKINEFVSLGGKSSNIWSLEKIDEYIASSFRHDNAIYSVRARMMDLLLQAYLWDDRLSFELPLPIENYKRCVAQIVREQI